MHKHRLWKSNTMTQVPPCWDKYIQTILGWHTLKHLQPRSQQLCGNLYWWCFYAPWVSKVFYYTVSLHSRDISFCLLAGGHRKWLFTCFLISFIYTLGNQVFYTHSLLLYIPIKQFLNLFSETLFSSSMAAFSTRQDSTAVRQRAAETSWVWAVTLTLIHSRLKHLLTARMQHYWLTLSLRSSLPPKQCTSSSIP